LDLGDTIAAISTPPGTGAIAIVRLSGPQSVSIITRLFQPASVKPDKADTKGLRSHHASYGRLCEPETGEEVDEVVVTPFLQPRSYTGEDLVEISCHGSPVITKSILALCVRQGARLARAGEFTERAFLSGRLDLTQAEAVLDLIQSKTSRQSKIALSALSGDLGRHIQQVRQALLDLLTRITAGIDFPEEVGDLPEPEVAQVVEKAIVALANLAQTARSGKFLREGLRLAIVGRPNAGKSSLLNQFLKSDRAIVTDIPGTTRDSLEELIDLGGLPVILVDTAGIRESDDQVELIGMARTARAVDDAQLILFVVDSTRGFESEERKILHMIGPKPCLIVHNKIDLIAEEGKKRADAPSDVSEAMAALVGQVFMSAKTGDGLDELTRAIGSWAFAGKGFEAGKGEDMAALNDRQAALCEKALDSLRLVRQTAEMHMPQDCLASDLKMAIDNLSEICGELVSEEVISSVFANFCIGK
jgi:tRNA modification GTPase